MSIKQTMKQKIKQMVDQDNKFLSFILSIYNHIPLNNKYKLRKNQLQIKSALLNKCKMEAIGGGNTIIIENGCILKSCRFYIHGSNNTIVLSKYVSALGAEFYIEDDDNSIIVGEHTSFSGKIHLACIEGTKIKIGKDCLLSSDIVFRTGDSHSVLNLSGERINPSADIEIEDHVWVGHRVLINKGVHIAPNSIVGTGAIVTKRFDESNVIVAGVPARIIKQHTNWCSARI